MALALLLISLSLLQGCIAPAVSDVTANPTPLFVTSPSYLDFSNPVSDTCKDLDHYRSLVSIVTSCLATIFASVWVAVHPNISGPKQSWIARKFESLKVVVVTLLVPEWVLAWAIRQFLQALHYAKMLEDARVEAAEEAKSNRHDVRESPNGQQALGRSNSRPEDLRTTLLCKTSVSYPPSCSRHFV